MFKNKRIVILSILFVILILFSCKYVPKQTKNMLNIGDEIIRCINEKDKVSLSNLFCKKIKNTDYLNRQIDFFFDYIDKQGGIIIDDGGKWEDGGGHGSTNGWGEVVDFQGCNYNKKVLIGNKEYTFQYMGYTILKGHKEYEGITHIMFKGERNLLDAPLEKINISKNDKTPSKYLGIRIYNFNYDTFIYENVAPKEVYENEEYRFSFDELEKNRDKW